MSHRHLLILRHPETTANIEGRWVGRGDAPYTDLGMRQAAEMVREIVEFDPEEVASSPLERTVRPASQAAASLGAPHVIDERLSELDFGSAEGLTFDEARDAGIEFDFAARHAPVAPGGESRSDILARTASYLDEVLQTHDRLAVVTHGGVFRSALVHMLGLQYDAIWAFHIRNATVAALTYELDASGGLDWARLEEFRQVRA